MKLLFTSVGRRVELVQCFAAAREKLRLDCLLIGGDLSDTAPALWFCDVALRLPPISDPSYIPFLLHYCEAEQVDVLIPTIDHDLLALANAKAQFERIGTRVLISSPDAIALCRDKRLTARFFRDCGLDTPAATDDVAAYSGPFPCFIKPLDGSSSVDAYRVDSREDLERRAAQIDGYIIQPYIQGTEYTIDVFCDFDGNAIFITPRVRLATRSGEVMKTRIDLDSRMIAECREIIARLSPCGPLTIQLIRETGSEKDYFIEINPRFGGGAPLSMKAGADSAQALLRLAGGMAVEEGEAADGLLYLRYDQSICVNKPKKVRAVLFDLDDTLYPERDYVKSGFCAVEAYLNAKGYSLCDGELWQRFCAGKGAVIDETLRRHGIYSEALRDACLEVYRAHKPSLRPYPQMISAIKRLKEAGLWIGLLTDGRPDGQNAKLDALGIRDLFDQIVITDALGGAHCRKPSDVGFRVLQKAAGVPFENMLYVGDNARKDFDAPHALGMEWLHFDNWDGLYHDPSRPGKSLAEAVSELASI